MKLENAGFVWVIKKLKYLIESLHAKVIIQTDHPVIFDIIQQFLII